MMNAANEIGVQAFIDGLIGFDGMVDVVEHVLDHHQGINAPKLEDYVAADAWARNDAKKYIDKVVQ